MAIVLLFLLIGTWLFSEVIALSLRDIYGDILRFGLNPVRNWWTVAFTWQDYLESFHNHDQNFAAALIGMAFYAILAFFFWWLACWRFRSAA